jgi:hypothetical protein
MSTPEQLKGHSKRRQLEKSIEYARTHNLEFADESQIEDIGVSAFRGANVKYGALGQSSKLSKEGAFREDHTFWLNLLTELAGRRFCFLLNFL